MPWNDDNKGSGQGKGPWGAGGNGGKEGGNNPSPWNRPGGGGGSGGGGNGQGGGGGGGGRRNDLEAQMRRMQERFRLRGSGGGRGGRRGPGGSFGPFGFLIIGLVALAAWFATGVVVVDAREQASVFRFGKWVTNFGPGFHVHWPYPIESHVLLPVEEQRQTRVGDDPGENLMLTKDENIVNIRFTVFWKINTQSPQDYILNVEDPDQLVKAVAESVMREVVGQSNLQPIITTGRTQLQDQVEEQMIALLENYNAGVEILDVQVAESDAPNQVVDAFRDVVNAAQDAATTINEADRYANRVVPEARGEAQQILAQAEAYKEAEIARATGDAQRFTLLLAEYRQAPAVTRERMFLETMERVLGKADKIIIDENANTLPFLPLDRLGQRQNQQ